MAGLTDTGLTIETITSLLASIVADQLANIDPNLNTEADSVIGQLNAIYAAALLECWELLEAIWQAGHADTATGQALSYIAALTGTIREAATKSTVSVRFGGTAAASVPAGTEVYVVGRPDSRYVTLAADVIGGGGTVDIECEAVTAGSEPYMLSGETLSMPNPPTNVTSATAFENSANGEDEESDADLRTRREAELGRPGSSTVEAIRSDLLEVTGVDVAQVYENPESYTDANGLPPHSIECIVYSANAPTYTAQDVVDAIWEAKPAGTKTYGSLSGTATDAGGVTHTIAYSEPTEVTTHVLITLTYDGDYIGDTAVKEAVAEWALDNLTMGDDVVASDIVAVVSGLTGVVTVDGANTGADSSTVASGNPSLTITLRQVATVDTADIDVTSTAA